VQLESRHSQRLTVFVRANLLPTRGALHALPVRYEHRFFQFPLLFHKIARHIRNLLHSHLFVFLHSWSYTLFLPSHVPIFVPFTPNSLGLLV
jgi:hypothetical protein